MILKNHSKKHFFLLSTLSLLGACSSRPQTSSSVEKMHQRLAEVFKKDTILYSANINGEVEPCGCRKNPTGGIYRRLNLINEKFKTEKIQIDSGDLLFQSTPVPGLKEKQWLAQARTLVESYNELGINVFTPGELDLANGLETLKTLLKNAKFKTVSANLVDTHSNKLVFEPYTVIKTKDNSYAFIGLINEHFSLSADVKILPAFETLKKYLPELKRSAQNIIVLSHLGIDRERDLAKEFQEISAIFGSHTQSFFIEPELIENTLIFQTSFRGQHLGYISFKDSETTTGQFQLDERFDSPKENPNILDLKTTELKANIAKLNKETNDALFGSLEKSGVQNFQTFVQCAQCHTAQYQFHGKTRHFKAYATLVAKKQNANLDCLRCHTVGLQEEGGWNNVQKLVFNREEKSIDPASFAHSLPRLTISQLNKTSKAYLNVQCETCHGAGNNHPFDSTKFKKIDSSTCLQCHTEQQAPAWYKPDHSPNQPLIQQKIKELKCPTLAK